MEEQTHDQFRIEFFNDSTLDNTEYLRYVGVPLSIILLLLTNDNNNNNNNSNNNNDNKRFSHECLK